MKCEFQHGGMILVKAENEPEAMVLAILAGMDYATFWRNPDNGDHGGDWGGMSMIPQKRRNKVVEIDLKEV